MDNTNKHKETVRAILSLLNGFAVYEGNNVLDEVKRNINDFAIVGPTVPSETPNDHSSQ